MDTTLFRRIRQYQVLKIAVCLFCLAGLLRADEESAIIYIKKAQEQIRKKEYTGALSTFQKAIDEAPAMPEIYFERGLMYWQAKELSDACRDFNKAEGLLKEQTVLTKSQQDLQKRIGTYQSDYRKIQDEFTQINQKYVTKFCALADKYQESGEVYLFNILTELSKMEPADPEIKLKLGMVKHLVLDQQKSAMTPLFNGIDFQGWDLLSSSWQVNEKEECITGDYPGGAAVIKHVDVLEKSYTLYMELKIEELAPDEKDYMLGFAVAFKNIHSLYDCVIFRNSLMLIQRRESKEDGNKEETKFLAEKPLPEHFDPKQWNTLLVKVSGEKISAYLNNVPVFEATVLEEKEGCFKGHPGLIVQNCKAVFKNIRYLKE